MLTAKIMAHGAPESQNPAPWPIRVLFINDTSRNGGPGRTMLDILKHLDPAVVHRVVLIPREGLVTQSLRQAGTAEEIVTAPSFIENLFEPLSRPMVRRDYDASIALKGMRAAGNILRAIAGFAGLVRGVRRNQFDVIFCNGTIANFLGGATALLSGTPAIWHVIYPSVPTPLKGLHRWLSMSRSVPTILCVSRSVSAQFDHCREKVELLADALDIDEFRPDQTSPQLRTELCLSEGTIVFGSHGRIVRRKGYIELIQAAKIVIDTLGKDEVERCQFVILGDTPQDLHPDHLAECRSLVREIGLQSNVHFLGFRADVRPYLVDFDIALVPSVYEDPLPRSVMESMAMAKPVIAFDVGGIGEMVTDKREGRLVCGRPPDVQALATACLAYFREPALARQHGLDARRRIEQNFDARRHGIAIQDALFRAAENVRR